MTIDTVTNSDVFLWALYELGGAERLVDVEEAFFLAFTLAPKRLSWRTREDLPDLKKCSKALRDAEAKTPGLLIKSGGDLRRLSVDGQRWIEDNFDRLAGALKSDKSIPPPKVRMSSRLVSEALKSRVYESWDSQSELLPEKWRYAELFRCSPDSANTVWKERLETLRASAYVSQKERLMEFLDVLGKERADWF